MKPALSANSTVTQHYSLYQECYKDGVLQTRILCCKCREAVCCIHCSRRHNSKPASSSILGNSLWSAFYGNLLPGFQTSAHCAWTQKAWSTFTSKVAFAKINWNLQAEMDAHSPALNSCMLGPIWIVKASPMKSSYTAAIVKVILYLKGLKAIFYHEPTSEQGTPPLWSKCEMETQPKPLVDAHLFVCNPALQLPAQGMLPYLHTKSCNRQFSALPWPGAAPRCWAQFRDHCEVPLDVPHWGLRMLSHL